MKTEDRKQLLSKLLQNPNLDQGAVEYLRVLLVRYDVVTRDEGNPQHVCSYFLPFNPETGKIFMIHHLKTELWLIPGGHVDPDETPWEAAVREWHEELGETISEEQLRGPFAFTITPISNPQRQPNCAIHFDIWLYAQTDGSGFVINEKELGETMWLSVDEAIEKTTDGNTKKALKSFKSYNLNL